MDEIYRIAVCDDDREQLDKMEEMLAVYAQQHPQVEFKTDLFSDSRKLVNMVEEKAYLPDLMLLDIYMPEKTGIEAAQELRELGSDCRIVLITASEDHALEAFGVGASQYLLKPVSEQTLFPVLDSLLDGTGFGSIRVIEEKIASMSCKAAVKGNNKISVPEAETLIDELLTLDNPYNCPHGRPTIVTMTKAEMERKFKRIVN